MKTFWNNKRTGFWIVVLLSIFIVFFLGRTFNSETLSRELTLTTKGITNFRRGLDISGGTKLTYRISYDKYEETYKNAQELAEVKQTVENIILKNIDGRISKLGVSDYKAYTQQLSNETQIIVEIGGVADLDQAKEIIGKTVELEFKLPNTNITDIAERKALAEKLHQDVISNPEKIQELTDNRASENIFYNQYEKKGLSELPSIYQNNQEILNSIATGKISDIVQGTYGNSASVDGDGQLIYETLEGFTFFRVLNKEVGSRTNITAQDIIEVATELGLNYNQELDIQTSDQNIASGSYQIQNGTLKYNNGELYTNQEAYDARILAYVPESTLGLTGDELTQKEESSKQRIETIKNGLEQDPLAEFEDAAEVSNGMIGLLEIKQAIPDFSNQSTEKVQIHEVEGITYIICILDKKTPNEKRFGFLTIENVNETMFEETLQSKTYYTIEEVFVQDKLSWVSAKTTDGKILNGANFKYASVSSSQMGQPVVVLNFDETGKNIFCNITENNIGKQMAIFIGGQIITAPSIQSKICDGSAQIDGQFTPESAKELTASLNDGALPAPLILMQEEKISPSLGESAFSGAIIALIIGIVAICIYMTAMYGFKKWLITLISTLIYTLVLLAIIKIIDYALSLSGIAAIILSIGMAIDANILIFERMREEKKEGKANDVAIKIAYERSRAAIKDAQLSTGLIGLLLFMMGINMFKGFGSMLVIGVILTLLINVPIIKDLLFLFYPNKEKKEKSTSK